MKKMLIGLGVLAAAPCAMAEGHNIPTDLTVICNTNGAVVTVNDGVFAGQTYYLGKSCDAALKGGGTGTWGWAASAFVVNIPGANARFANELDCPSLPFCRP